jgi:hypothetical protein
MIAEKWDLKLDVARLQQHLKEHVFDKEITKQSEAFGGWSVLSPSGDYRDGWVMGHLLYEQDTSPEKRKELEKILAKKVSEYTIETEICTGYMQEVVDLLRNHHLSPRRARIIRLTAKTACSWHFDTTPDKYLVRLHVPIITNPGCFFETRDEKDHLPADGSAYFIYVNREHRVINYGTEDRYHLVVDVTDEKGFTQYHRLADFIPA